MCWAARVVVLLACAAQSARAELVLAAIGNWGGGGSTQRDVGTAMNAFFDDGELDGVVALGDNFPNGVASDTDPVWETSYTSVFSGSSLQVPWYVLLGDLDYALPASPQAQINYDTNNRDNRWYLPSTNYTVDIPLAENSPDVLQLVVVDTERLLHTNARASLLAWLESTLARSEEDPRVSFVVVAGHHPLFAWGETVADQDSGSDNNDLEQALLPLLLEHKVDLYLCAHYHTVQHIQVGALDVALTSAATKSEFGTAAPSLPVEISTNATALYLSLVPGFVAVSADDSELRLQFVSFAGRQLYTVTHPKQQWRNREAEGDDNGKDKWTTGDVLVAISMSVVAVVGLVLSVWLLCKMSREFRLRTERRIIKERLKMEVTLAKKHGLWQVDDDAEMSLKALHRHGSEGLSEEEEGGLGL